MKKIMVLFLIVLLMSLEVYADEDNKTPEFYWQATGPMVYTGQQENKMVDSSPQNSNHDISKELLPWSKIFNTQLTDIVLKFDSLSTSISERAKTMVVDTIELRIGITLEGKFFVASGKSDTAVTIILKRK